MHQSSPNTEPVTEPRKIAQKVSKTVPISRLSSRLATQSLPAAPVLITFKLQFDSPLEHRKVSERITLTRLEEASGRWQKVVGLIEHNASTGM